MAPFSTQEMQTASVASRYPQIYNAGDRSITFSPWGIRMEPKWAVGRHRLKRISSAATAVVAWPGLRGHLMNHPKARALCCVRGNLGDALMLIPSMAALRKEFPDATLAVSVHNPSYAPPIEAAGFQVRLAAWAERAGREGQADVIVDMMEPMMIDHNPAHEDFNIPRPWLFAHWLGLNYVEKAGDLDWHIPIPAKEQAAAEAFLATLPGDRPLVGVELRTTHPSRHIPLPLLKKAMEAIPEVAWVGLDHEDYGAGGPLAAHIGLHHPSVLESLAVMERLDAVVTFDSGLLWMAHIAHVPTVLLVGIRRASSRITCHPLYPDGKAVGIETFGWVGCQPCGQQGGQCRKEWTCMKALQLHQLVAAMRSKLLEVLS